VKLVETMSSTFDCRCCWASSGADPASVHAAVATAGAFVQERGDVPVSMFSREGDRELLELSLEARDEGAANTAFAEILDAIETRLGANGTPGVLKRESLEVESAAGIPAGLLQQVDDLLESAPMRGVVGRKRPANGTAHPIADPYTVMLDEGTNGANYDLDTESILERLQTWEEESAFEVLDVGPANVTLRFGSLPKDLEAFAAEAYEFCPDLASDYDYEDDATDQGAIDAIAHGLSEERILRLWWD